MIKFALLVQLEAKPGKENELENFLKSGLPVAQEEKQTITWYAIRLNESTYGIFDTFHNEDGRQAHLSGKIAQALMAKAPDLLSREPVIEFAEVISAKLS
jgi:quinol monooxygenase YgiN